MTLHLHVDSITKVYGETAAVESLSFDVEKGEFFTLLGPSGCGKSTTLGIVAGFVQPDAGTVFLDGVDITEEPPDKRNIGVVFQSYALFPHMTVLENVMFPLEMRGVHQQEAAERARNALGVVRLDLASSYPSEISGGQAQRVALARSFVFEPQLLLMDEPLAALDRKLRHAMQFELREIQDRIGTTVVYVTHDQEEALVLADRIAVMRSGRFEQIAAPDSIYNQPANGFVAGFIGESNRVRVARNGQDEFMSTGNPDLVFNVTGSPKVDSGTLIIRPEHVEVETNPEVIPPHRLSYQANIDDLVFVGDHLRVKLALSDGTAWVAKLRAFAPSLEAIRSAAGRAQPVWVHWPSERAQVLSDDSEEQYEPIGQD